MNLLIYRYHVSKLPQRIIPKFHLNFWCEIFVEAHSFRTLSSNFPKNSAETVNFHRIYAQRNKVKLRYFMQCLLSANVFVAISSRIHSCILPCILTLHPFFRRIAICQVMIRFLSIFIVFPPENVSLLTFYSIHR